MKTNSALAKLLGILGGVALLAAGLLYALAPYRASYGLVGAGLGVALLLAAVLLARHELKAALGRRSVRLGLGAGVSVLAVLALAIFLGALAARHHYRLDLTETGRHTLAEQTVKLLADLPAKVEAIAFFKTDQPGRSAAEKLLDQYRFKSERFSYRFVDPDQDPALAKLHKIREYGTVVLLAGDKSEQIKQLDEQGLTNGLMRLLRDGKKTVYFLKGHGERGLADSGKDGFSEVKKAILGQNYEVKELILATSAAVPADAAAVIAAGPEKPLLPQEKDRLAAYLKRGGGVLLLIDPQTDPQLGDWLKERGIVLGNDLIIDLASKLFGASPSWPLSAEYGVHPITAPMGNSLLCIFPLARSVRLADPLPQEMTGENLVLTSNQSWAEVDLGGLAEGRVAFDEGQDLKGPVPLAAAVSLPGEQAKPKEGEAPGREVRGNLVVFGDADFAANANYGQLGNLDIFLNAISFLAEDREMVSIRPKQSGPQPLLLQPQQMQLLTWIPLGFMPLACLVAGAWVVIKRRRRMA